MNVKPILYTYETLWGCDEQSKFENPDPQQVGDFSTAPLSAANGFVVDMFQLPAYVEQRKLGHIKGPIHAKAYTYPPGTTRKYPATKGELLAPWLAAAKQQYDEIEVDGISIDEFWQHGAGFDHVASAVRGFKNELPDKDLVAWVVGPDAHPNDGFMWEDDNACRPLALAFRDCATFVVLEFYTLRQPEKLDPDLFYISDVINKWESAAPGIHEKILVGFSPVLQSELRRSPGHFEGIHFLRDCIKWYGDKLKPISDAKPPFKIDTPGIALWGHDRSDAEQLKHINAAICQFISSVP